MQPSTFVLCDIGELVTLTGPDSVPLAAASGRSAGSGAAGDPAPDRAAVAAAESALGLCTDATVVVTAGQIVYAGPAAGAPSLAALERASPGGVHVESAGGRLVSPGLCDPHTHLVWAGERSREFDLRNLGAGYAEIQQAGGGILSTVERTAAASDDSLIAGMRARLDRALAHGVTRCEVKTGYALWPQGELRLLGLIGRAAAGHAVAVAPTFLCHIPPKTLGAAERPGFVRALAETLPAAAAAGATAVDVYCDAGAFTLAETELLLQAGQAAGLLLRCHAEQFTRTGAAERAAALGAVSVEHLEQIDDAGIAALARGGTVANLLPGAALTLRLPWPDARRLVRAGVRVALGTDWNPGSSHCDSQPLMMALACTQMGLSCAEAWLAVTRHAAQAILGAAAGESACALLPGQTADLVVWDAGHYREICQHLGGSRVHAVYPARGQR